MQLTCIILGLLVVLTEGGVVPKDLNKRELSDKALTEKLSQIKDLLQELQDEKDHKKLVTEKVVKDTTPPPHIVKSKEPMADNGLWQDIETDTKPETLSKSDEEKLKELKRILENARRQKMKEIVSENREEDLNGLGDDGTDSSEIMWRELARKLQSERDQLYLQEKRNDEDNRKKVKAVTTEGFFLPIKDEILASVEKNLMTDLALAIHSGITLDEIIQDMTRRAQATD